MSFGQYFRTTSDGMRRHVERAAGHPVDRELVDTNDFTKADVLAGVERQDFCRTRKTGNNEATREYHCGERVVRVRNTDILIAWPCGSFLINTGGWNTPTTRAHLTDALAREAAMRWMMNGNRPASANWMYTYRSEAGEQIRSCAFNRTAHYVAGADHLTADERWHQKILEHYR